MGGITLTTSANVSLLNNFEIVATSLIALVVFKETITKRLWVAVFLVTVSSIILGFEGTDSFVFNRGSLLVLGACICWGLENNCTKMLSSKSSVEIVTIKGCFSGLGSLVIAFILGEKIPELKWVAAVCVLGFVAYGLSINFYIMAQKDLGAAKTSAFYSVAPFLGVGFSILLVGERPGLRFYAALAIMVWSTILMIEDTLAYEHTHIHTHEHRHGTIIHTHEHEHTHSHIQVHMVNHVTGTALHEHSKWLLPGHSHSHAN